MLYGFNSSRYPPPVRLDRLNGYYDYEDSPWGFDLFNGFKMNVVSWDQSGFEYVCVAELESSSSIISRNHSFIIDVKGFFLFSNKISAYMGI